MIVDQFGQPIDTKGIREPQTSLLGAISREFDSHPARGLTPSRLAAILVAGERGDITQQLDLADDIEERDGHCFSELDKRAAVVAGLDWNLVEPPNASAAEKDMTAKLKDWMASIDVEGLVRGMMGGVLRAFACHEMVWTPQSDGSGRQVLLPEICQRPQRWFTVDREQRNTLLLRTDNAALGEPLQPFSWIAHVHRTRNGYLARMGLARILAWPYLYKNFSLRDLAEFLEIYGLPLRLGKYPSGASDDEKRKLLQAVSQIGHNAAGIVPSGMVIDFVAAAEGSEGPYDSMQDRMEAVQSKVIVGQTLTSGEGQHGTQALGTVHNEVRMDIRDSDARQVGATITAQLVYPMAALNIPGIDPRRVPRFVFDIADPEDLKEYADSLPSLVNMGMRIPTSWAHDKLQIPQAANGEAVLLPTAAPTPTPIVDPAATPAAAPLPAPRQAKAALAGQVESGGKPDALDALVAEAASDWQPQLGPIVNPLLEEIDRAIAAGESIASFRGRLPQLVTQMDYRPMGLRQAQATFVSALAGAADLDLQSGN
jgi:phage gp29-like protein